ncbi:DUF402 domain-containing protein [Plantibacter sp. YIM 135249]|uniref:DUF402 domain-containing protein n=1 Tax=Plantibacter sp. YIM 135249 TaxID=3423918 RepID=UPI003D346DA4
MGEGAGGHEDGGTFSTGDRFVFQFRKWDGAEHWSVPAVWLGEDKYGQWFGQHPGTLSSRPGASFITDTPNVSLVPDGTPWVATFYPPGHHDRVEVYIDLAADVVLTPERQSGIDMDLDVIRTDDDRGTWIDDEDEFEDHAKAMSYPADVMELTETAAAALRVQVESRIEPFDRTPFRWLAVLATLPR